MGTADQLDAACRAGLYRLDLLRRRLCLSRHPHQPEDEKISELHFYFPLHHAPMDAGRRVAKPVQQPGGLGHGRWPAGRSVRAGDAGLVGAGPVPERRCAGAALCPVCVHSHRRNLPQHGRQPRGSRHHSQHAALENFFQNHPSDGEARHTQHRSSGVQQLHGVVPGAALSESGDAHHKVRGNEREARGTGQYPRRDHGAFRRADFACQPADNQRQEELYDRHGQVRTERPNRLGTGRQIRGRRGFSRDDTICQHSADPPLRDGDVPAQCPTPAITASSPTESPAT